MFTLFKCDQSIFILCEWNKIKNIKKIFWKKSHFKKAIQMKHLLLFSSTGTLSNSQPHLHIFDSIRAIRLGLWKIAIGNSSEFASCDSPNVRRTSVQIPAALFIHIIISYEWIVNLCLFYDLNANPIHICCKQLSNVSRHTNEMEKEMCANILYSDRRKKNIYICM